MVLFKNKQTKIFLIPDSGDAESNRLGYSLLRNSCGLSWLGSYPVAMEGNFLKFSVIPVTLRQATTQSSSFFSLLFFFSFSFFSIHPSLLPTLPLSFPHSPICGTGIEPWPEVDKKYMLSHQNHFPSSLNPPDLRHQPKETCSKVALLMI